jgi:hypothetical protein
MDCKTARMLLEFARPRTGDLDSADLADLERHLAACPECDEHARNERFIDQHLAKAMQKVEVPDRLRPMLRARLAEDCDSGRRKRVRKILAYAGAVAALLLVGLGIYLWQATHLPAVDVNQALLQMNGIAVAEYKEEFLRKHGLDVDAPIGLNYNLLTSCGMTLFQGKQVPLLIFAQPDRGEYAQVYLLTSKQFDLKSLIRFEPDDGYKFKAKVLYEEGNPYGFVVFYTGDDRLKWLLKSDISGGNDRQTQ